MLHGIPKWQTAVLFRMSALISNVVRYHIRQTAITLMSLNWWLRFDWQLERLVYSI